jgi:thymidylate synthase ThyX
MKVNESELIRVLKRHNGICDFCGCRPAEHYVNENRWHICHPCMRMVQEDIPQAIKDSFEKWLEEEE